MKLRHSWLSVLVLALAAPSAFPASPDDDVGKPKTPPGPAPLSASELANRIDALIQNRLILHGIEPAPLAGDAEFVRRVYLDLAGRIPTEAEARAFLADKSTDRRVRLVDALLNNPMYVRHMGNTWQNVMAPSGMSPQFAGLQPGFRVWLDSQLRENAPYDLMVRELLTAPMYNMMDGNFEFGKGIKGRSKVKERKELDEPLDQPEVETKKLLKMLRTAGPAAGAFYFQVNDFKAENLAASTARQFLGVRLECAQCHNHPFTSWTRQQFWQFATFFADTRPPEYGYTLRGQKIALQIDPARAAAAAKHEMKIPGTDKVVQARFLDGQSPNWSTNADSRQTLADWITAPSNPYFARTGANRLWAHFFGRGIIDPVDDEPTSDNPASHAELLTELTEQFVSHKFDMKYLIRAIALSKTYQRSSAAVDPSQHEPRLFARMAVKGLSPEQLFDNLALATGYQDPSGNQPGVIVPNTPRGDFLLLFATQDRKTETQTSILQALTLMNGSLVADATSLATSPKLTALLSGTATNAERIETLYLSTLSRLPRPEEASRMLHYVERGGAQGDPRTALADVYWALLNSAEFMFNH